MKVSIIGSRTCTSYELVERVLDEYTNITEIISGGAKGADSLGERYANEHNILTNIFHADWNKYGKSAGYIRNADIINNCDSVIAFWDMESKGTLHSLKLARKKEKDIRIVNIS